MEEFNGLLDDMLEQSKSVNVAKLGKVVNFKPETMSVDVLPMPSEDSAMILNVPVATIKTSDYLVYYPLKAGDIVVLLFVDNDTDNILLGEDNIATERQHDISDCICLGGITLLKDNIEIEDQGNIVVKSNEVTISIGQDIKVKSPSIIIESAGIELKGNAQYNGSEIAVKGDSTSDGATIV